METNGVTFPTLKTSTITTKIMELIFHDFLAKIVDLLVNFLTDV